MIFGINSFLRQYRNLARSKRRFIAKGQRVRYLAEVSLGKVVHCFPVEKQFHKTTRWNGIRVKFVVQEGNRYQFSKEPFTLEDSL